MSVIDYLLPEAKCVNCGKVLDAATPATGGHEPTPGDVALCLRCHHVQIYDDDMQMREPTDDEALELADDPEIFAATTMLKNYKLSRLLSGWKRG